VKLIWDSHTTDTFVKECVKQKKYVQRDDIPLKAWKAIKTGHKAEWEVYRAKFHNMNSYFANSMLTTGGVTISGVEWPYYRQFLDIHDIPLDFAPNCKDGETPAPDVILTPTKKSKSKIVTYYLS